jgi:integrase
MSIVKRRGKWYYRFNLRGREYIGSSGLDAVPSNRKDAEQIEARVKLEALAGNDAEDIGLVPFKVAADEFLRWCETTEYRGKPNTARRIRTSFASLQEFFRVTPVCDIGPAEVEKFKTWRFTKHGVREITVRHDLHALSVFYRKYAIKACWAASNPVDDVSKPSDRDSVRIHVLTPDEEAAYFEEAAKHRNVYDLARLILLQGCRPEEILSLQWSAIDLDAGRMKITGGKTRAAVRALKLTSEAVDILRRRQQRHGDQKWVFPSSRVEGGHIVKLNNTHDRVCQDAGVSFVLYDLRHTFATRMLTECKCDPATLATIMGHSGLKIIMRYVHPQENVQDTAMLEYERSMRPRLRRVK